MASSLMKGLSEIAMKTQTVTNYILLLEFTLVNACIIGNPDRHPCDWVLVDAAIEGSADAITKAAEERFGKGSKPKSIILTHGHFDHIGSVIELSKKWKVPVYAHDLEMPYLTGQRDYPAPDPTVDGGLIAQMSPLFPRKAINLQGSVHVLPSGGSIPGAPDWRWIHTPGHTPGHICLFRERDGVIIAGDAFTTVKQESALSVLTQEENISGPPAYFTTDWKAAEESVKRIAALKPSLAVVSHGQPMKGEELSKHLELLSNNFDSIAVPEHGRYVDKQ